MKKLLNAYESYLLENNAKNTAASYMGDVTKYLRDAEIKTKKDLAKIKEKDISEYVLTLKSRGMAYSSVSRNIASLKKFFSYCKDAGVKVCEISQTIELPKAQRKLPNTMTNEEVVKLLEAPDISTPKGIRDKAMLEVMYATGAKVSELIAIKTGDLSLKNEMIVLTGGGKHRIVPLGKAAIEALHFYMRECRPDMVTGESGDVLFLNFYGQPLTRQGFWKVVKKYIKECGIAENMSAQTLRHSFALHLLKNGADTASVSEMLGYSDVSSTKIYLEVMNNKIKEVYKNTHPRA